MELYKTSLLTDANLEGYYRLEDANDSSAKGRNLTTAGAVIYTGAGKYGFCASAEWGLHSSRLYIHPAGWTIGVGDFTMGCWIKKGRIPTDDYSPGFMQMGTGNPRTQLFAGKTTGYASFYTYSGTTVNVISSVNICDNNWHLVIAARNGTSHKLYVDNVEVASATAAAHNLTDDQFEIGNSGSDSRYDMIREASIDDAFIFSRSLSVDELNLLYFDPVNYLGQPRRTRIPGSIISARE